MAKIVVNIHPVTSNLFSFSLISLSLIKSFSSLADKFTLGKASSKLNEVLELDLSIGCR